MGNPRTPFDIDKEIVRRRFEGFSRDAAAKGLASTGEASKAMVDFVQRAEAVGLLSAADEYGVKDTVEGLLVLARRLKEEKMALPEAHIGSDAIRLFNQAGIPTQKRSEAARMLKEISTHRNPRQLLKTADEIREHAEQCGMSYSEVVPEFDQNVQTIRATAEEERKKTTQHEDAERRKTTQHAAGEERRVREITAEQETKLRETRRAEEDKLARTRKAHERSLVITKSRLKSVRKTLDSKTLDLAHTTERLATASRELEKVTDAKHDIIERAKKMEEVDREFKRFGITTPEEKAIGILEVDRHKGDVPKLVEASLAYGNLDRALKSVKTELGETEEKLRDTKTALKEHSKEFDKTVKAESREKDGLKHLRTEVKRAKNHLNRVIRTTAKAEGLAADLRGQREAIRDRKTTLEDLDRSISSQTKQHDAILGRVSDAEGVEKSITGIKQALVQRQAELNQTVERIAKAHDAEPTLSGLEAKENALNVNISELSTTKSDLDQEIGKLTIELSKLGTAKDELEEFFQATPKLLDSIETRLKENKRMQLILGMFSDRLPSGSREETFQAIGALVSSFGSYISLLPETPQIAALRRSVAQLTLAIGSALRATS